MSRKPLILLGILTIIAVLSIAFILSKADLPNKLDNGFERKLIQNAIEPSISKQITEYAKKISGTTPSSIFFSGQNPAWVLKVDRYLNIVDTLVYGIELTEQFRDPGITIDSPYIYMYSPEIKYLVKGFVDSTRIDTLKLKTELFSRAAQISPDWLVLRAIDSTQSKQVFQIMDCRTGETIRQAQIINDQQFGGFEHDGHLRYDKSTNSIFFVQMFQNRYFCMDTMLNIKYIGKTIDTTNTNMVKIGLVTENGVSKVMASKPRIIVNQSISASNGRLFVVSGLRADKESLNEFNKVVPVDMYDASSGKYLGSFHLSKGSGDKILDFIIDNKTAIVLFKNGICNIYALNY
ncbi:hypothetical protein [Chitinophaga caseinilytica]|uniref:hypothetical protein n=1 Tax=Chitinophaga caseinilytica TaxID=2267521 RepID=UPI003C2F6374